MQRTPGCGAATCAPPCSCCDGSVARAPSIALIAAAAPLCVPSAAAIAPGRSGLYGGGAIRDYVHFVSVRVAPGGDFRARALLVTKCSPRFGDLLTESISVSNARLSERGRYSETTSFSDELEPGIPTVGGLRAAGTIEFSVRVRRPAPDAGSGRPRLQPGTHRGTTVDVGCPSGIGLPLDVVAHRVPVRRGRREDGLVRHRP